MDEVQPSRVINRLGDSVYSSFAMLADCFSISEEGFAVILSGLHPGTIIGNSWG